MSLGLLRCPFCCWGYPQRGKLDLHMGEVHGEWALERVRWFEVRGGEE